MSVSRPRSSILTVVALINAAAALLGTVIAAAAEMSAPSRVLAVAFALVLAGTSLGVVIAGAHIVRRALARPQRTVVVLLCASLVCQSFGWRSPLWLSAAALVLAAATVAGGRSGLIIGAVGAGGYLVAIASSTSVAELTREGDLIAVPVNALAFLAAGLIGDRLARARRLLDGLEIDIALVGELAEALRLAVDAAHRVDGHVRSLLASLAVADLPAAVRTRVRAARDAMIDGPILLALPPADGDALAAAISRVARWHEDCTGLAVTVVDARRAHEPVHIDIARQLLRTVLRCLQNTRRHAPTATRVVLTLTEPRPGWVQLSARDDGGGVAPAAPDPLRAGRGLSVIAGDLAAVGATLTADTDSTGFGVHVQAPAGEQAAAFKLVVGRDDPAGAFDRAGSRVLAIGFAFAAAHWMALVVWDPWTDGSQAVLLITLAAAVVSLGGLVGAGRPDAGVIVAGAVALAAAIVEPSFRAPMGMWLSVTAIALALRKGALALAISGIAIAIAILVGAALAGTPGTAASRLDVPISLALLPMLAGIVVGIGARRLRSMLVDGTARLGALDTRLRVAGDARAQLALEHDLAGEYLAVLEGEHAPRAIREAAAAIRDVKRPLMDRVRSIMLADERRFTDLLERGLRERAPDVQLRVRIDALVGRPRSESMIAPGQAAIERVRVFDQAVVAVEGILRAYPRGALGASRLDSVAVSIALQGDQLTVLARAHPTGRRSDIRLAAEAQRVGGVVIHAPNDRTLRLAMPADSHPGLR